MFTRTIYYQCLKIEQSIWMLEKNDLNVVPVIGVPLISVQEWAKRDLSASNIAENIHTMVNILMPVKEVWSNQKLEEIISDKILDLMKEDNKLFINKTINCEDYGLFDDEVPF